MKNNSFLLFSKACCWTLFNYLQGEQYLQHGCSIFFLTLLPPSPQGVRSLPLLLGDSIPVPSWYEFKKKIQYQYQLECSKVDTCPILVCTLQHLAGQIQYQYQAGMHLKKEDPIPIPAGMFKS
jgi:hypothetical protein